MNGMAKKKHSALGKRLIASAKEMAAHARGRLDLDVYQIEVPPQVDVIAIRKRLVYLSLNSPAVSDSVRAPCRTGSRADGRRRAPRAHTCWSLHGNRRRWIAHYVERRRPNRLHGTGLRDCGGTESTLALT